MGIFRRKKRKSAPTAMRGLSAEIGRKRILAARVPPRAVSPWRIRLRRTAVVLILLGLTGLLAAAAYWGARRLGGRLFWENDDYRLRAIDVTVDGRLSAETVLEFLGYDDLREGANLRALDVAAIRANFLRRTPSVSDMTLAIRLPDRLEIRVVERTPMARLEVGGDFGPFVIDRHGIVFFMPRQDAGILPAVRLRPRERIVPGADLSSQLAATLQLLDFARHPEFVRDIRIRRVDAEPEDYLECRLDTGTIVHLSWTDMEQGAAVSGEHLRVKLAGLRSILLDNRARGRMPLLIDLTHTPDYIPVTFN